MTDLAVYTLLKCAVPEGHPAVQRGVSFIERNPPTHTCAVGTVLMALGALRSGGHDDLLRAVRRARPACRGGVWTRAVKYAIENQERYKKGVTDTGGERAQGYTYHANKGATGSMTAAGLSVLVIASKEVQRVPISWKNSVARGLAWFDLNFSVTSDPYPDSGNGHENARLHYYLYGLERVGSLLNLERIGGRDGYAERALALLESQNDPGLWGNQSNTCFALLFLTRATADRPMTGREPSSSSSTRGTARATCWLVSRSMSARAACATRIGRRRKSPTVSRRPLGRPSRMTRTPGCASSSGVRCARIRSC